MNTSITKYNCITNIGRNIDEVYQNAIKGVADRIVLNSEIVKGKTFRVGMVSDNDINITILKDTYLRFFINLAINVFQYERK